jgi:thiamine pyrophosphate-dependent acetolactate synthase large subunit-like protein
MNIQELATAHIERIAAKALVINNQHLGMVVQWEDRFYQSNRGHTYLGDPQKPQQVYPDFVAIAKGLTFPPSASSARANCARRCSACWRRRNRTSSMSSFPTPSMYCR